MCHGRDGGHVCSKVGGSMVQSHGTVHRCHRSGWVPLRRTSAKSSGDSISGMRPSLAAAACTSPKLWRTPSLMERMHWREAVGGGSGKGAFDKRERVVEACVRVAVPWELRLACFLLASPRHTHLQHPHIAGYLCIKQTVQKCRYSYRTSTRIVWAAPTCTT